jgi:hypothetical protein
MNKRIDVSRLDWGREHEAGVRAFIEHKRTNPEQVADIMTYLRREDEGFLEIWLAPMNATAKVLRRMFEWKADWEANGWPPDFEEVVQQARQDLAAHSTSTEA